MLLSYPKSMNIRWSACKESGNAAKPKYKPPQTRRARALINMWQTQSMRQRGNRAGTAKNNLILHSQNYLDCHT